MSIPLLNVYRRCWKRNERLVQPDSASVLLLPLMVPGSNVADISVELNRKFQIYME